MFCGYDLEFVEDLSQLSIHDCDVDVDECSVDGCRATSRLRPRFQGDLVAVALDPLPNRELPRLTLRDPQHSTQIRQSTCRQLVSGVAHPEGRFESTRLRSNQASRARQLELTGRVFGRVTGRLTELLSGIVISSMVW